MDPPTNHGHVIIHKFRGQIISEVARSSKNFYLSMNGGLFLVAYDTALCGKWTATFPRNALLSSSEVSNSRKHSKNR
jgi:hypothetical protein